MSATLHFDLKKIMPILTKEHRWDVLSVYILHANERNRAWCSTDTIKSMVSTNKNRVIAIRKWLVEHGALVRVPKNKRFGKQEESLDSRLHIYELTGKITIDSTTYQYLYTGDNGNQIDTNQTSTSNQIDTNMGNHLDTDIGSQMDTLSITKEDIPIELKDSSTDVDSKLVNAVIQAWIDKRRVKPTGKPFANKTYRGYAKQLVESGFTSSDVEQYMDSLQSDGWWADKSISFKYVCENLPLQKVAQPPTPQPDPHADNIRIDFTLPAPPPPEQIEKWRNEGKSENDIAQILALGGYTYEPANS